MSVVHHPADASPLPLQRRQIGMAPPARRVSDPVLSSPAAVTLVVANEYDVGAVIAAAQRFCTGLGATPACAAHVATAASELAHNLWMHSSHGGRISLVALQSARGSGVELVAQDDGPGIADIDRALDEGFSTGGGLGCGLPGVRRLMDEFDLVSAPGLGTRVVARKWWR